MANIGTTTAFYKVETSLSRANNEVSKSMERLATGKRMRTRVTDLHMLQWQIRLDGLCWNKSRDKRCIRCDGVFETGCVPMQQLISRLQELAVAANDIQLLTVKAKLKPGDEFNRFISSTYKGKDVFVSTGLTGGRDAR